MRHRPQPLRVQLRFDTPDNASAAEVAVKQFLGRDHIVDEYFTQLDEHKLRLDVRTKNNSPLMLGKRVRKWAIYHKGFRFYFQRPSN